MQFCVVCSEQIPKYRCPVCRIRYCSVGCFKKHKGDDSCQPVQDAAPPAPAPCPDFHPSGGESKDLKTLLQNPHLRNLMLSVYSAQHKDSAIKNAMQEPLFVELANQCLKIVEPTEVQDDDNDD